MQFPNTYREGRYKNMLWNVFSLVCEYREIWVAIMTLTRTYLAGSAVIQGLAVKIFKINEDFFLCAHNA